MAGVGTGLAYLQLGALIYTGALPLALAGTAALAMRTAALDALAEHAVFATLRALPATNQHPGAQPDPGQADQQGRISVLITHRLANVRNAHHSSSSTPAASPPPAPTTSSSTHPATTATCSTCRPAPTRPGATHRHDRE